MPARSELMRRVRRRMDAAVLFSLLVHVLALTIQLKGPGPGVPDLRWPWKEMNSPAQILNVVLAPARLLPAIAPRADSGASPQAARSRVQNRLARPVPNVDPPAPRPASRELASSEPEIPMAPVPGPPEPVPAPESAAPPPAPAIAQARLAPLPERHEEAPPAAAQPPVLEKTEPDHESFVVPKPVVAEPAVQPPSPPTDSQMLALATREAEEMAANRAREEEWQRQEARRQEAFREALDAEARARVRDEEARRRAEDAAREEARRRAEDAAREEALQQSREVEARRNAQEQEARRAAEEAARAQSAALERQKQGERFRGADEARAAEQASTRSSSQESSGASPRIAQSDGNPATKAPVGTADSRPVARPAIRLPVAPPDSVCRRPEGPWGRPNPKVATYAAVWRHVIRQNAPFDLLQGAKAGSYENPVVTVAVRSDGTVEGVTFNKSSGIAQIDEAVRRIIEMLAPYESFPRELEMDCDVIEIPSTWSFDRALRLTWRGQ